MADSTRGSGMGIPQGLPLLGILLFLSASGFFFRPGALKQLRPAPSAPLWAEHAEPGTAASRMWQDPLQAIGSAYDRWRERPVEEREPGKRLAVMDAFQARLSAQRGPWLAAVMLVSGSNYSDSESSRLDQRVALVAALGEAGYVPEDRERLKFVVWRPDRRQGKTEVAVPFEWFRKAKPETPGPANVLLVWMRGDALDSSETLRGVQSFVDSAITERAPVPVEVPSVVLLTSSSNRLIDLAYELITTPDVATSRAAHTVRIVDWSATIAPRQLSAAIASRSGIAVDDTTAQAATRSIAPEVQRAVADAAKRRDVSIERRIGTDGELMDAMVHELALRGIVPGIDNAHVAIVHEYDTAYGRAAPDTFIDAVVASPRVQAAHGVVLSDDSSRRRAAADRVRNEILPFVETYAYLQGIDGVLPVPSGRGGENSSSAAATGSGAHADLPEGRGQLDYVRRLCASIRHDALREGSTGTLRAIGVFGGVYDKVPVLQALRAEFPDALLFTTDLEARLIHASADGVLRNVLIASHFGLEAGEDWQKQTPPFRSGYQTSLFLAMRHVLGDPGAAGTVDLVGPPPTSRVYEIGRGSVHDLRASLAPEWVLTPEQVHERATLHPESMASKPMSGWTLLGGTLGIIAATALFFYARRVHKVDAPHELEVEPVSLRDLVVAGLATIVLSSAVVAWHSLTHGGSMIGGYLDSISLVERGSPTIVARVAAVIPDVVLLAAMIACARLAFLAAIARRSSSRQDVVLSGGRDLIAGSASHVQAIVWIGLLAVFFAASARLWHLDHVSMQARVISGVLAIGVAIAVSAVVLKKHQRFRDWIGTAITRHLVVASIVPAVYLILLLPRLAPEAARLSTDETSLTLVQQLVLLAPPILAIGGALTAVLVFRMPVHRPRERDEWSDILQARNWGFLATAVCVFIALAFAVEAFGRVPDQEPVSLFEGISAWPSIVIRVAAIVLGIWFLAIMRADSRANIIGVTREWSLLAPTDLSSALRPARQRWPLPLTIGWNPRIVRTEAAGRGRLGYGQAVWGQYIERTGDYARFARTGILLVLFLALIAPLIPEILRHANAPYAVRGETARILHEVAYLGSLATLIVVTLLVWDISNVCQRFIALCGVDIRDADAGAREWKEIWHPTSIALVTRRTGLRGEAAESYLTLRVIADRTRWVSTTIYYPFILIVLLLVAGAGGFDAWPQSWYVVAAVAIPAIVAVVAARSLQSAAKRLRERTNERLQRAIGDTIPTLSSAAATPETAGVPAASALDTLKGLPLRAPVEITCMVDDDRAASRARFVLGRSGAGQSDKPRPVPISDGSRASELMLPEWVDSVDPGSQVRCSIPLAESGASSGSSADERLILTLEPPRPTKVEGRSAAWTVVHAQRVKTQVLTRDDVAAARTLSDGLRYGAFASYADNPILRALLLPFGGFGAIQIVDYVMRVV